MRLAISYPLSMIARLKRYACIEFEFCFNNHIVFWQLSNDLIELPCLSERQRGENFDHVSKARRALRRCTSELYSSRPFESGLTRKMPQLPPAAKFPAIPEARCAPLLPVAMNHVLSSSRAPNASITALSGALLCPRFTDLEPAGRAWLLPGPSSL